MENFDTFLKYGQYSILQKEICGYLNDDKVIFSKKLEEDSSLKTAIEDIKKGKYEESVNLIAQAIRINYKNKKDERKYAKDTVSSRKI